MANENSTIVFSAPWNPKPEVYSLFDYLWEYLNIVGRYVLLFANLWLYVLSMILEIHLKAQNTIRYFMDDYDFSVCALHDSTR